MNLDFSTVEIKETSVITPGIHEVTINKVEEGKMPFGDNIGAITLIFSSKDGAILTERLSLKTEKSETAKMSDFEKTMQRLAHIGHKLGYSIEEFKKIKTIPQLSAALVGKPFRCKFTAKEYKNKEGGISIQSLLPLYKFAEPLSVNPTRLVYDKTNEWDYQVYVDKGTSTGSPAVSTTANDDLPF